MARFIGNANVGKVRAGRVFEGDPDDWADAVAQGWVSEYPDELDDDVGQRVIPVWPFDEPAAADALPTGNASTFNPDDPVA